MDAVYLITRIMEFTRGHGKLRLSLKADGPKWGALSFFKQRTENHWGSYVYSTLDCIQKLKRPLRIPPKRTKPHKFSQIISQKIGKIGKIDYPISDSSTGLGNTKRPIQHTLVHQLSGKTPFIVIHPLVWAWKGVRHRVSDSVFKVTRIIE